MLRHSIALASVSCVLLTVIAAGCHTVPLGDPEKSAVDSKLNGWYQADKPGTLAYITPYDSRTYVATIYGYEMDGTTIKPRAKLTNKAWMTSVGGMDVMTFKLIDPEWDLLESPDSAAARYSYYRIRNLDNGAIEATQLNTDFLRDTKTPEELAKKIADNVKNEELWKNSEPMIFRPVTADKIEDAKAIVKAFVTAK